MLKKLIKYDIKRMSKILIYFYACSIILAGITRLINIGKDIQIQNIIGMVFAGFTYSAIINIIVNTFVHIIRVFITNFYKDQSYLTHTLPIKKDKLLLSKYLSSLIVTFCSVLVCFLSLFIMLYSQDFMTALNTIISAVVINLNISSELFVVLIVLVIFTQVCALMSFAFTAIVKGNSYNRKRGLKGFIWFLIFYLGCMMTTLLTAVIIFAINGNISELLSEQLSQGSFITLIVIALITYIFYSISFYFVCRKEFNKGVNVD